MSSTAGPLGPWPKMCSIRCVRQAEPVDMEESAPDVGPIVDAMSGGDEGAGGNQRPRARLESQAGRDLELTDLGAFGGEGRATEQRAGLVIGSLIRLLAASEGGGHGGKTNDHRSEAGSHPRSLLEVARPTERLRVPPLL